MLATTPKMTSAPPTMCRQVSASPRSSTENSVSLTWAAVEGAAGYTVYRDGSKVGTAGATSFNDSGLANSTTYTYTVATLNSANVEGAKSSPVSVKTKVPQPVPAEVGAAMQQLSGKSYTTAEDYIKAAGSVLTPETAERMKQPLADCARNNALFWIAVLLIALAGAAHQAWSANLYTTVSDMFPKKAVASLTGIGGMAGSIGGILFPTLTGWLIDVYQKQGQVTKGYAILFTICAFAYVIAFAIHHMLAPKFDQVSMTGAAPAAQ